MATTCFPKKVHEPDANQFEKKQPHCGESTWTGPKPSHRDVGTSVYVQLPCDASPQEGALNHQGGKQANFSKKPTHKDVDASGNLQATHDTGYGSLTGPTWNRKKTGASTLILL